MDNIAELIKQHDDYVDLEVLENTDPETREAILTDPEELKSAQEASREFRTIETVDESVVEDAGETQAPEIPEIPVETPTNLWDSWGWTADEVSKLELSGKIKDGKYLGRFSPEQQREYIKYTQEEEFKRGQLGNELGETRKALEEAKERETFNKVFYEAKAFREASESVKVNTEKKFNEVKNDIYFDTDLRTLGADDKVADTIQQQLQEAAWAKTQNRLKKKFKDYGVAFPQNTKEALDDLYSENQILYDAVMSTRDDMFRDEVLRFAKDQQYKNARDYLVTLSINDSWNIAKNDFQEWGINPDESNEKVASLLRGGTEFFDRELQNALSRGDEPDQAYFYKSPDIGWVVRPEAFRNYLFNQHKDIVADPKTYFKEPVKDTPIVQDDAVTAIATSLRNAHEFLTQKGINLDPEGSPEYEEAFRYMNARKGDTDFWRGSLMREDAFERYFKLVRPDLLWTRFENTVVENAQKKIKDTTKKITDAVLDTKIKRDSAMKMASSEQGKSKTGIIKPIPPPHVWNDPFKLAEWRKEQGLSTEELQAEIVPRIKAHPNKHLYNRI